MPLLNILNEKYSKNQIFNGLNMVVTIHLEAKTAYLAQVLKNAGANVVVTGQRTVVPYGAVFPQQMSCAAAFAVV